MRRTLRGSMVAKTNPGPSCEYAPTAGWIKPESNALIKGAHYPAVGRFDCGGRADWKMDERRRILAGWPRSFVPNCLRSPSLGAVPHHGSGASTSALRFLFVGLRAPIQVPDSPGCPVSDTRVRTGLGRMTPKRPREPDQLAKSSYFMEPYGRDRPFSIVVPDRNSQAV
jgi:hypothetical protein